MIRVNVICEGPTEEQFVRNVLYDHFIHKGIALTASSLGGGFNYHRLKNEIIRWLNNDHEAYVTTLVDLYGMNGDYPGYAANRTREALEKVAFIEAAVGEDILASQNLHNNKFIPHFQCHEFESLLFSDPDAMYEWLSIDHDIPENCFADILSNFDSPEHINDSRQTAPSWRIKGLVPTYEKINEGIPIIDDIGLETIRDKCEHFDSWLTQLEDLSPYRENSEEE